MAAQGKPPAKKRAPAKKKAVTKKKATAKKRSPRPTGRPTDFTPALGDAICERICDAQSLRTICADDGMPNKATVMRWLAKSEQDGAPEDLRLFRDQYARAQSVKAETLVEEIGEIHEKAWVPVMLGEGVPLVVDGKPVMTVDKASVAAAKLEADNKKWLATKLSPKKYGERVDHEITGKNGGVIKTETTWVIQPVAAKPDAETDHPRKDSADRGEG